MRRFTDIVAWLVLAGAGTALAGDTGGLTFERNDRVFTWKNENKGSWELSPRLGLDLDSELSTSLNKTTGRGMADRWYDTVYNRATIRYRVSDVLDVGFAAGEDWNRDTMSRLGNSLITSDWQGNAAWRPLPGLTLESAAGYLLDERFDNRDDGSTVSGKVGYNLTPVRGLSLALTGDASTARLERPQELVRTGLTASYLRSGMRFGLDLSDDLNERGYFSDVDRHNIERRARREQDMAVTVARGNFGRLEEGTALEVRFGRGFKSIDDTANNDSRSSKYRNNADGDDRSAAVRIGRQLTRRLGADWGFDYSVSANGVERPDRRRTQTDVQTGGGMYAGFGAADSVRVTGLIQRTRIDTPEGVANDRDELKIETGVGWSRVFTDRFKTNLDFRVLETHYVHIDVSQSSQNKWMKTYLVSPTLEYAPVRTLVFRHAVNVYANWITYDFDTDYAPRSNISRRVSSETWVDWTATHRTTVRAGCMFEDNEYARLTTDGLKIPSEEGLKRFGDIAVEYILTNWLTMTPSYNHAIRHDWTAGAGDRSLLRREVDRTFALDCRFFSRENGSMTLSVKRIVRDTVRYPTRIRNYITLNVRYGF